jgi:hypothetical protein
VGRGDFTPSSIAAGAPPRLLRRVQLPPQSTALPTAEAPRPENG